MLSFVRRSYSDWLPHYPLLSASSHIVPDSTRTRKLLLNAIEIKKLIGKVEQKGYTLVPLNLHFSKGNVKCEIGLARGKSSMTSGLLPRNGNGKYRKVVSLEVI